MIILAGILCILAGFITFIRFGVAVIEQPDPLKALVYGAVSVALLLVGLFILVAAFIGANA